MSPPPNSGPCAIVIFGSTGDLTLRKLIPALFSLDRQGLLHPSAKIVGFARGEDGDEGFRARCLKAARSEGYGGPACEVAWGRFRGRLVSMRGDYADPAAYAALATVLKRIDTETPVSDNFLFYLAVPPSVAPLIVRNLGSSGLARRGSGTREAGWTRAIFEKPFGRDKDSAHELNALIASVLDEDQVYRIDHYLGKETVQNILALRFANSIFEPLWNREHVMDVQVTVAEKAGVGTRGRFYEEAGALRDMVQNHLLQLMAMVAMEPPVAFEAAAIRDEKLKVLRAIRPVDPAEVDRVAVRGQYGEGSVDGARVPGYRSEPGVVPDSPAETFAALKLFVDNWRWAGIPFYLRTGKRLPATVTEVFIRFGHIPHILFRDLPEEFHCPNELKLRIQPDEGISLTFGAKVPGSAMVIKPVSMDFSYSRAFGDEPAPAYERLVLDALRGDASLFIREDAVAATWAVVQPVLDAWDRNPAPAFPDYAAGTWGPPGANALVDPDGRRWRNPGEP
jgi:glucose-6-phosphate 1-dehydrogenase